MSKHITKFEKNVEFLVPFFNAVKKNLPTDRLISVKGYKVPINLEEKQYGSTIECEDFYTITLKITNNYYFSKTQKNTYLATILDTFAHELAHLVHWEHTPEHYALQAKISLKFVPVLKRLKIKNTYARID